MAVPSSHTSSPVKCSSAERSTTFVTAVQMDLTVLFTECARGDYTRTNVEALTVEQSSALYLFMFSNFSFHKVLVHF